MTVKVQSTRKHLLINIIKTNYHFWICDFNKQCSLHYTENNRCLLLTFFGGRNNNSQECHGFEWDIYCDRAKFIQKGQNYLLRTAKVQFQAEFLEKEDILEMLEEIRKMSVPSLLCFLSVSSLIRKPCY